MEINNRAFKEYIYDTYADIEVYCNDEDNDYLDFCSYWFEVSDYISDVITDNFTDNLCSYIESKCKHRVTQVSTGNPEITELIRKKILFHAQMIFDNRRC